MRGGLWGLLENLVLEEADVQDIRVSVLGGPIFADGDPEYRGARIPREFWKLIAYRASDGKLTASAFVLSQKDLIADLEAIDFDPFRLFQVSVATLEGRTRLGLAAYRGADVMAHPERISRGTAIRAEVEAVTTGEREVFDAGGLAF
jgi:endonuclease G